MDKFEKTMEAMSKMSREEQMKKVESMKAMCICPDCPLAEQVGLKYSFFCTRGAEKAQRYEHTIWGATLAR